MKPLIIQVLGSELSGKSRSEARGLIEKYFSRIAWSLEKEEWDKMSEPQKTEFVKQASKSSAR